MAHSRQYAAFLSYAHEDEAIAQRVQRALENYAVPKTFQSSERSRLSPIFRDITELGAHHSLPEKIRNAVENSRFLIVLCSPASKKSHWVNEEIRLFRKLHGESSILCAVIDGTPGTAFPPVLTEDGREPLAADMTGQKESFKFGITQMAASMLGVELDDLAQRQRQRARRRVTLVTALSAIGMAVMGTLTWTAIDARQEAEQRRNDAEGQIEFMITDLKDVLESVGRLDALKAVGERASSYYGSYALSDHDDDALGRRSRVYHYLGEIQDKLGNLPEADRYFQKAFDSTEKLLAREPDNAERVLEHGHSAYWIAYRQYKRRNYEPAKEYFTIYLNMAERLQSLEGDTDRVLQELAYTHANMGNVALEQRLFVSALKSYEKSSSYKRILVEKDPDDISRTISLAKSFLAIGDIHLGNDQITDSIKSYSRGIELISEVEQLTHKKNSLLDVEKVNIYRVLARLHLLNNDPQASEIHADKGIEVSKNLMRIDGSNVEVLFQDILLHFLLFELAYIKNDMDLSKDLAKTLSQKATIIPESLKDDNDYDILAAIGLNTDLLSASLPDSPERDLVVTRATHKILAEGLDKPENLAARIYYTDAIILADAMSNVPKFKTLLEHMCNDPDLVLDFQRKVSLGAYIGASDCPNAASLTPLPISSVEKFLSFTPPPTPEKN